MPAHNEAVREAYASLSAERADLLHAGDLAIFLCGSGARGRQRGERYGFRHRAWRDGGATVTFIAYPFTAEYLEQREGQPPSTRIKIDNVNRELVPQIRAALGTRQSFRSSIGNISAPIWPSRPMGRIEFELRNAQMVGSSLTGTAMVRNLQNKRFPRA